MNETDNKLEATIKHLLILWDEGQPNEVTSTLPWQEGYTKGWKAALNTLADRMGVDL